MTPSDTDFARAHGAGQGMPPRVRLIIAATAREHGLTFDQMLGHDNCRAFARARWVASTRIVTQIVINGAPASLPQIGRWMNRDHTTILYGLRRYATNGAWSKKPHGVLSGGRAAGVQPQRVLIAQGGEMARAA